MEEIAWAAGFFDGEGTSWIANKTAALEGKGTPILALSIPQKDIRPLKRFAAVAGCGNIGYTSGVPRWRVSGRKAENVKDILWPYLSEPKREQIIRVMAFVNNFPRKTKKRKAIL